MIIALTNLFGSLLVNLLFFPYQLQDLGAFDSKRLISTIQKFCTSYKLLLVNNTVCSIIIPLLDTGISHGRESKWV